MGRNRAINQSEQTWKISMKELQEQFGVDQGELFQAFLCVCNYKARGWSFKRIMNANSTIHSNVMQLFAVIGFLSISGKMGEMIERSKCETNKFDK